MRLEKKTYIPTSSQVSTPKLMPDKTLELLEELKAKSRIEPKFLTLNQVEAIYNIGRGKLYEMMKLAQVRCVKLGNRTNKRVRVLVDVASLEAYLNGLPSHVLPSFENKTSNET
jgi:hypothetical protein